MNLPRICEKTRVARRPGVFLVLSIHEAEQTVELMTLDHIAPLVDTVPFSILLPFERDVPLETA